MAASPACSAWQASPWASSEGLAAPHLGTLRSCLHHSQMTLDSSSLKTTDDINSFQHIVSTWSQGAQAQAPTQQGLTEVVVGLQVDLATEALRKGHGGSVPVGVGHTAPCTGSPAAALGFADFVMLRIVSSFHCSVAMPGSARKPAGASCASPASLVLAGLGGAAI